MAHELEPADGDPAAGQDGPLRPAHNRASASGLRADAVLSVKQRGARRGERGRCGRAVDKVVD